MITEDKVTEIFCITDDFCKVFDVVSRSIPHLAMNEAALQIAPITFSCSIALFNNWHNLFCNRCIPTKTAN